MDNFMLLYLDLLLEYFKTIRMRVQIAPQSKSKQSSIMGYRVSPQHGNTISSKPYAATRINY